MLAFRHILTCSSFMLFLSLLFNFFYQIIKELPFVMLSNMHTFVYKIMPRHGSFQTQGISVRTPTFIHM